MDVWTFGGLINEYKKNEIVTISCKCGFLKNVTEQNKEVHNPNTGGIIMKTHELKIWPEYFKAVKNGTKTLFKDIINIFN